MYSFCLRAGIVLAIAVMAPGTKSQCQIVYMPNAYAHNDYWHKHPLTDALSNGYGYVEADIYLKRNSLVVTHIFPFLKRRRNLEKLYLKPLSKYIQDAESQGQTATTPITLMLDIKSDGNKTYNFLLPLLRKYKSILSGYKDGCLVSRQVRVVLSGHKPYELVKADSNRLAFIDDDLRKVSADTADNAISPMASCRYSRIIKWKGKGELPADQHLALCKYVQIAHANGRKVRLWASPENEVVWRELLACGVDLINTNKLLALKKFLLGERAAFASAP